MANKTKVPKRTQGNKLTIPKLIFSAFTSKRTFNQRIKMHVYENGISSNKAATGIQIEKGEKWDSKSCEVIGNDHKTKYLIQLKTQLDDIYYNFRHRGHPTTPKLLLECLTNRRNWINEIPNLANVMLQYNESRRAEMLAGKLAKRSFTRLGKWRSIIIDFCKYQYKEENIPLSDLKPILGKQVDTYLRAICMYSDVYTAKVCRYLKTCLSFAQANEWTTKNVLLLHKWTIEPKDINALTNNELKTIESLKILDEELDRVRNLFVFCSYTAFGFSELSKLRLEHLFQTTDGIWYLCHPRSKTRKKAVVALAPKAIEILQKYSGYAQRTGRLLPAPAEGEQDGNRKLKALASAANFSRFPLTWYVGRRTCATYLLNEGASLETVAAHLGNTPDMVRRFYAQKRDETIIKEVSNIFNRNKVV